MTDESGWDEASIDKAASAITDEIVQTLHGAPLTVHSMVGVMIVTYVVNQLIVQDRPDLALALAESLRNEIEGTINLLKEELRHGAQETASAG